LGPHQSCPTGCVVTATEATQQKRYRVLVLRRRWIMPKIELDAELIERIDRHLEEGETRQEFLEEILSIYESEGAFIQESE
jgi:hypothetical protein